MTMRYCWIFPLLVLSGTLARSLPLQPCPSDALETTFQASDGPDHGYTLAIGLRNISAEPCYLDNYPGGTGLAPNHSQDGAWSIKICYYCEQGQERPSEARITLAPGESVHQTRSWKTTTADGVGRCVFPSGMGWDAYAEYNLSFFRLSSLSLLKPICSRLVTTNYASGQFLPDKIVSLGGNPRVPAIKWTNEVAAYSREQIPLRVTVEDPSHVLSLDERSCPRIFVRVRDATTSRAIFSRLTRIDELQKPTCKAGSLDTSGKPSVFVIDFDASYAIKQNDEGQGEYTIDVSSLAELKRRYLLAGGTAKLHLSMVDGRFVKRNWGPSVDGAAVSLTLDKEVYTVGSEIPLHIALENVSSSQVICAADPRGAPPGVDVELRDSSGQTVPRGAGAVWVGHGGSPDFYPGLVVPAEWRLSQMGFKPDHPGIYTLIAIWSPSINSGCGPGIWDSRDVDNITVRSSPVNFSIVTDARATPRSALPPVTKQ